MCIRDSTLYLKVTFRYYYLKNASDRCLMGVTRNCSDPKRVHLKYTLYVFIRIHVCAPVSYTHLDVYKRQVLDHVSFNFLCNVGDLNSVTLQYLHTQVFQEKIC